MNLFKLIKQPYSLLLLFLALTVAGCSDDDDNPPTDPVDQLPPATQTGAQTFGCLLDGEVFLSGNTPNNLDCVYQFTNGAYYFSLQGNKRDSNNNLIRISLNTKRLEIHQNDTYILLENIDENAYGSYFYNADFYYTNQTQTGELKITKLDYGNHIVAGTFWFDIKDSNGVVHKIREGRFDVRFTE
tara:strand:+ start:16626 stop:17183 length:558 start_codon:yes stop_codon:yes gene_type:complete